MMRAVRQPAYVALLTEASFISALLSGAACAVTPLHTDAGLAPATAALGHPDDTQVDVRSLAALGHPDDAQVDVRSLAALGHPDDVVDYVLRATLDPATHIVHGEGTIVWRNKSASPVSELWFHLYLNAFKNEGSTFLRERIGGRGSAQPEDWGWIDVRGLALHQADGPPVDLWQAAELRGTAPSNAGDDETDVRVPLPRPIAPGQEITLDVAFDDKLPAIVERTGYQDSFHMVGQWFPKLARLESDGRWVHFPFHHLSEFYADFGSYDVTLDVPAAFTLGATGALVDSRIVDGRRIERHVQRDVHDFAWTAWDRFESRKETIDGVAVTLLYPPGYARMARRELAALRFALPYYSSRYGRYPYDVLTVVHPPYDADEASGMEYPTLITTGGAWWTPPGVLWPEVVTVHELGHQWFYGIVATNELAWPVLDEGLTQFAEADAMAAWRGEGSLLDIAGLRVSDIAVQAVGGNMAVHDEPVAQAASAFSSGANYERLVYARTASLLETCARVYGSDAVARSLAVYARRYRFEHPAPEQLIGAFADVMGPQVAATLREALFEKGWVDYVVDGISTHRAEPPAGVFDRQGKRERVEAREDEGKDWDSSVVIRRRGTLSFPVDVQVTFSDDSTRRERWSGDEEWKRFEWRSPAALRAVVVDPDDRVLVDMDRSNNFGAPRKNRRWAPRTLEQVTYWLQLALQALSP
jgi:hypothetical protein